MSIRDIRTNDKFVVFDYVVLVLIMFFVFVVCIAIGSVNISFWDTIRAIWHAVSQTPVPEDLDFVYSIIVSVRLPRVICVALSGAALSICGGAMQGLLKNPLADGSTLGVSSGAALGAVISIAIGLYIPNSPVTATMLMAMAFAFLSMLFILSLSYRLDYSLSTNTIILIGVIFSMFASSVLALITTMASHKLREITFWTMGSLAGSSYLNALILLVALVVCGGIILKHSSELNAFAIGEDNARHIGVNIKRTRLTIMIMVSALIGVCVSIGGSIGFVGLVTPHIVRMIVGPNHKKLLPASLFGGATFLMLADLVARTLISPLELRLGIVTSFIGAIVFVIIFYKTRKAR
ncbi:MAG: iron ABC transporter permease [Dehalococcoidales bacterium]|nr:iron ABC transporter permease [Dehalococcoidales bacterium]